MYNARNIILIFQLLSVFCLAQSQIIVRINKPLNFYLNIPNPIEVGGFNYKADKVRFISVQGRVDTVADEIYWIPYNYNSLLIIQHNNGYDWESIDTVEGKKFIIKPEQFSIKVNPITRHAALPYLTRFDKLELELNGEVSYLPIADSIAYLVSYTAIIYNESNEIVDSQYYSLNSTPNQKLDFIGRVRNIQPGQYIIFKDIYIECVCWRLNDGNERLALNKEFRIKDWK